MDLHFDFPNYQADILRISNTNYQLEVYIKATKRTRVYSIKEEIKKVESDNSSQRVIIQLENGITIDLNFDSDNIFGGNSNEVFKHIKLIFSC